MNDTPTPNGTHADPLSILKALENDQGLAELLTKIQPLIAGNRLHNLVDVLSLLSDLVDISDNAIVEKLSGVFEGVVSATWEGGSALSMAHTEMQFQQNKHSLRSTYTLLKHPDTLKGIALVLRTLQIIGKRIPEAPLP
ncbi:MAG: hypothetical protein KA214_01275 [Neisseriaceae bacterium]|nr:hypothetical protein [Neisseriaceae bacterium]